MSRSLTSAMKSLIGGDVAQLFLAVEFQFPAGTVRFWSGVGDLLWAGVTWTGLGALGELEGIGDSRDSRAKELVYKLSGIPSEYVDPADFQDFQNSPAKLYLGGFDDGGNVVADPYLLDDGVLSTDSLEDDGELTTISFVSTDRVTDALRPVQYRYTHEDQQLLHPNVTDNALGGIAQLQDQRIKWGGGG